MSLPDLEASDAHTTPSRSFPFFALPSELRLRIYELVLFVPDRTIDLDPTNYKRIRPHLSLLFVCHRMHEEAFHVFYGSLAQSFRVFPIHGRFFHTSKPLLARLSPRYRAVINTVELRLGPGWSAPPKCWNVGKELGLRDCASLRLLKLFVELDPSDDIFMGFRGRGNNKESYQLLSLALVDGILEQVPSLEAVELDAYPGVSKEAPLVLALARRVEEAGKKLIWGSQRGWNLEDAGRGTRMMYGLEDVMIAMTSI